MNLRMKKVRQYANSLITAYTANTIDKRLDEIGAYRWIPGQIDNLCRILDYIIDQEKSYGDTVTAKRIAISIIAKVADKRPYLIDNNFYIKILSQMKNAHFLMNEIIERQTNNHKAEIIAGIPKDKLTSIVEQLYEEQAKEHICTRKNQCENIFESEKKLYMPIVSLFNECNGSISDFVNNDALVARLFTGTSRLHIVHGEMLFKMFFATKNNNKINQRTSSILALSGYHEVIENFITMPTPQLIAEWLPYLPKSIQSIYASILRDKHQNLSKSYCPRPVVTNVDEIIPLLRDQSLINLLSD